jgi:hypothetical protein
MRYRLGQRTQQPHKKADPRQYYNAADRYQGQHNPVKCCQCDFISVRVRKWTWAVLKAPLKGLPDQPTPRSVVPHPPLTSLAPLPRVRACCGKSPSMARCRALGKRLAVMFFLALRTGGINSKSESSFVCSSYGGRDKPKTKKERDVPPVC